LKLKYKTDAVTTHSVKPTHHTVDHAAVLNTHAEITTETNLHVCISHFNSICWKQIEQM